jgi:hypothetical protein
VLWEVRMNHCMQTRTPQVTLTIKISYVDFHVDAGFLRWEQQPHRSFPDIPPSATVSEQPLFKLRWDSE